jgi:hypothetical protein
MIESGSFRDPQARVFYHDGRIVRGLSPQAAETDAAARNAGVINRLVARGLLVENWLVDDVEAPSEVPNAAFVESERIPVVSYPSEWSFAMLREAADATLEANLIALESGFILKDASAFNVLFDGTRPRIIDVTSVDVFGERGIWTAYGQFCDHFLSPLMLEAYAGLPYQTLLQGRVDGLPIGDLNRLLRGRAGLHKGVITHVRLRSALERRGKSMDTESRTEVGQTSLPRDAVVETIRKTRTLVEGLESSAASTWADYEQAVPYQDDSFEEKAGFVRRAASGATDLHLALDVGANAGHFTKILSEHFDYVVGIDNDAGAVDALFASARAAGLDALIPLVIDITNPTPRFGWRGVERTSFTDRVQPSFATWLAVVHHLCLGLGIPLAEVVALIFEISRDAVVEFVAPEDPMARHISATRQSELAPYSAGIFEELANSLGTIKSKLAVSATRTMYHLARA